MEQEQKQSKVKLLSGYKKGKYGQTYFVTAQKLIEFARFVEQHFAPDDKVRFDFAYNAKKFSDKQPDFFIMARNIFADFDTERKCYYNYTVTFLPEETQKKLPLFRKSEKAPF